MWRLAKPHADYCVDLHKACLLRLLNRTDCYVWISRKKLRLFVFEVDLINSVTDKAGRGVRTAPLVKLNVKIAPPPSLYFGIYGYFGFGKLLLFCIFRSAFRFYYSRPHLHSLLFLNFLQSFAQWVPFSKTSSYVTAPDQNLIRLYFI